MKDEVKHVVFSSDGKLLSAEDLDGMVYMRDITNIVNHDGSTFSSQCTKVEVLVYVGISIQWWKYHGGVRRRERSLIEYARRRPAATRQAPFKQADASHAFPPAARTETRSARPRAAYTPPGSPAGKDQGKAYQARARAYAATASASGSEL